MYGLQPSNPREGTETSKHALDLGHLHDLGVATLESPRGD